MSIQGQLLEVTVVGCSKLKDTEWISRQDPFVCLEYATTKFRTRTCTDGGRNPRFQEKTMIPLIEGLREISISVWNSNTIAYDDFIGSGRVQLQKVLSEGYDDSTWSLQSKSRKYAGDVKLIMHYAQAGKAQKSSKAEAPMSYAPTASVYNSATQYALPYAPLQTMAPTASVYNPATQYALPYAPPQTMAPTASVYNPATQYALPYAPLQLMAAPSYPSAGACPAETPYPAPYPPPPCPPPANPAPYQLAAYPPPPMPPAYPTAAYPPTETYPPAIYPPPPQAQPCYQPAPYRGVYPPPPY